MSDRKWRIRAFAAIASVGTAAVVLAACTTTPEVKPNEGGVDSQVVIAETNEFFSMNAESATGLSEINLKLAYLTRPGFYYISDNYEVVPNESFGSMEIVNEDPLQVQYTLTEGMVWSDGARITTDDLVLGWSAVSGIFDDATFDADGTVTSGTQYFTFAGSTEGIDQSTITEVSDDKLSLTLEYDNPFVDWNLIGLIGQPAHVVAEKAGVELDALVDTILTSPRGDATNPAPVNEPLKAAANFWNTGFDMASLPSDPSLYLSSGPWIIDSWQPTRSMTLRRNPDYTGALTPQFDTLVIRFIGDPNAQVTALRNGEVDLIVPQASGDTFAALEAISDITVIEGNQLTYDHLDLTFSGPFADPNVREAFLKSIPRQQIVDTLIKPVVADAEVLNSRLFIPEQDSYAGAVASNGSDAYAEVDIEGATELLAGATPTIRLLYNINNPNRVATFEAIQASASQAGFIIEDVGREDWGSHLGSDIYDAAVFAWFDTGVGNTRIPQLYASSGGSNFNKYANARVDEVATELSTTLDPDVIDDLTIEADAEMFADAYGLPLFQVPGLTAHTNRLQGVTFMGNLTGPLWNFWEWTVSE